MKEIDGNAGAPEMPEAAGEPVWKSVIEAPGFAEAWERAREQARRGEEVPLGVVESLCDVAGEHIVLIDDTIIRGEAPLSEIRRSFHDDTDSSSRES